MSVFFINNHGGGFAAPIEVPVGTRVDELFSERMPGCKPEDYLIRVNRLPVASDHVLQDGDRISITPTKVHGAA